MMNPANAITITQVEAIRAGVLSVVTSGASMLVLLHVIFLDASQLAGITAFASNLIVLVFLFWKPRTANAELIAELVRQLEAGELRLPSSGPSRLP